MAFGWLALEIEQPLFLACLGWFPEIQKLTLIIETFKWFETLLKDLNPQKHKWPNLDQNEILNKKESNHPKPVPSFLSFVLFIVELRIKIYFSFPYRTRLGEWPANTLIVHCPCNTMNNNGEKTFKPLQLRFYDKIWIVICRNKYKIVVSHSNQWSTLTVETFRKWWTTKPPSMTGIW